MNRRLFVNHLSAGLALLPLSSAAAFPSPGEASGTAAAKRIEEATAWLRNGPIGTVQRLAVSRVYSPARTSVALLCEAARQDFRLAGRLLGTELLVDVAAIFEDPTAARFGTYSARYELAGLSVVWQGLARLNAPGQTPTGRMLLLGSQGILRVDPQTHAYQAVDWRGRILPSGN